jgi:ArsR family transcriptional regulator
MSVYATDATEAQRIADLAKALADPVRVRILATLREREDAVCQCELQPLFGVSQPTLSHHMRRLDDAGIVDVERRGKWAFYSVAPGTLAELRTWLEGP